MNLKNFTIAGYARFYRSLPRFYHNVTDMDAQMFTCGLYKAVNAVYRHKNPGVYLAEYSEANFLTLIRQRDVKPYRTEVQLYRAMEALFGCLEPDALTTSQIRLFLELAEAMSNSELRFYKAFDMEIDDERTIYRLCARSLTPRRDEPGVCLIQDWADILAAQ
jgi:hypothetical protein